MQFLVAHLILIIFEANACTKWEIRDY
uniref:Uncharacterized protein n=1 Tax=Heterorhabditis bacteriophora TaxID=37862 RepID=A0A1I7WHA6_HETBA